MFGSGADFRYFIPVNFPPSENTPLRKRFAQCVEL
jgi:hypothetical protein